MAIDQVIASKADADYDPNYPVSEYDFDMNPRGVYDRVKEYVESKEGKK